MNKRTLLASLALTALLAACGKNGFCKLFQRIFVRNIPDKPVTRLLIDNIHRSAFAQEGIRNSPADSVGSAGNHSNFSVKSFHPAPPVSLLRAVFPPHS